MLPARNRLQPSVLTQKAHITSGGTYAEKLTNGHARPIDGEENAWVGCVGDPIEFHFDAEEEIREIRLTLDSDLGRKTVGADGYVQEKGTVCNTSRSMPFVHLPKTLVREICAEVLVEDGSWERVSVASQIKRRVVYLPVHKRTRAVRVIPLASYGCEQIKIFTADVR